MQKNTLGLRFAPRAASSRWRGVTVLLLGALASGSAMGLELSDYPRLRPLVDTLVREEGFSEAQLAAVLNQAIWREDVLEALSRPAERLPWYRYRPIFVTPERIAEGVGFARENQAVLARAAEQFGVPAPVIAAIIGVETRYGRHRGRHRVLDSLATIAASDHRRNDFFRDELYHFLLLTREEALPTTTLPGSYAGAMGIPQFIASSYRRYAVDFDGDGQRDLIDSMADAIGSVANYLVEHGWRPGAPMFDRIVLTHPRKVPDDQRLKPERTRAQWEAEGVLWPDDAVAGSEQAVALLGFETENGGAWIAAYDNFYAVTRYNHSALYALAVAELAEAIRHQLEHPATH